MDEVTPATCFLCEDTDITEALQRVCKCASVAHGTCVLRMINTVPTHGERCAICRHEYDVERVTRTRVVARPQSQLTPTRHQRAVRTSNLLLFSIGLYVMLYPLTVAFFVGVSFMTVGFLILWAYEMRLFTMYTLQSTQVTRVLPYHPPRLEGSDDGNGGDGNDRESGDGTGNGGGALVAMQHV